MLRVLSDDHLKHSDHHSQNAFQPCAGIYQMTNTHVSSLPMLRGLSHALYTTYAARPLHERWNIQGFHVPRSRQERSRCGRKLNPPSLRERRPCSLQCERPDLGNIKIYGRRLRFEGGRGWGRSGWVISTCGRISLSITMRVEYVHDKACSRICYERGVTPGL